MVGTKLPTHRGKPLGQILSEEQKPTLGVQSKNWTSRNSMVTLLTASALCLWRHTPPRAHPTRPPPPGRRASPPLFVPRGVLPTMLCEPVCGVSILIAPSVRSYDSGKSGHGLGAPSLLGGNAPPPMQRENKHSPGRAQTPITVRFWLNNRYVFRSTSV